jgi:hypothetical protein
MYINAKMMPIEITPEMGVGIKENDGRVESKYNIFDIL